MAELRKQEVEQGPMEAMEEVCMEYALQLKHLTKENEQLRNLLKAFQTAE